MNIYTPNFPTNNIVSTLSELQLLRHNEQTEKFLLDIGSNSILNSTLDAMKIYKQSNEKNLPPLKQSVNENMKKITHELIKYKQLINQFIDAFKGYRSNKFLNKNEVIERRTRLEENIEKSKNEMNALRKKLNTRKVQQILNGTQYHMHPRLLQVIKNIEKLNLGVNSKEIDTFVKWRNLEYRQLYQALIEGTYDPLLEFYKNTKVNHKSKIHTIYYHDTTLLDFYVEIKQRNLEITEQNAIELIKLIFISIKNLGNVYFQGEVLIQLTKNTIFMNTLLNQLKVGMTQKNFRYDRTLSFSKTHDGFDQVANFIDLETHINKVSQQT